MSTAEVNRLVDGERHRYSFFVDDGLKLLENWNGNWQGHGHCVDLLVAGQKKIVKELLGKLLLKSPVHVDVKVKVNQFLECFGVHHDGGQKAQRAKAGKYDDLCFHFEESFDLLIS